MSRAGDLHQAIQGLLDANLTCNDWISFTLRHVWDFQERHDDMTGTFCNFVDEMLCDLNDDAKKPWLNQLLDLAIEHARESEEEYQREKAAEAADIACERAHLGRQLF